MMGKVSITRGVKLIDGQEPQFAGSIMIDRIHGTPDMVLERYARVKGLKPSTDDPHRAALVDDIVARVKARRAARA